MNNRKVEPMTSRRSLNNNTILLLMTIALFVVMYAAGCIVYSSKGFARLQSFIDILKNNAGLICATCGMTAVMITGGIDISVGSLIAMNCMFLSVGVENWGLPAELLLPLMLVIGIVFGAVQGFCVGYLGIQPFIVTMAGLFFGRGMTAVLSTQQISIQNSPLMKTLSTTKIYMPFEIGAYLNKKGKLMVPNFSIYVVIAVMRDRYLPDPALYQVRPQPLRCGRQPAERGPDGSGCEENPL